MRILFVGAVDASRHALLEVLRNDGDVIGVITLPAERASAHADFADLTATARENGIPVHEMARIDAPENIRTIRSLAPDVIFVFGWSQLVGAELLELPPLGCIGVHPALLPRDRGRHPIIWPLVDGATESGVTFFYMDEGADSGDILWQKKFDIELDDDAGTIYEKVKLLMSEGIAEFLPLLRDGCAPRVPQDHARASYRRKRGEKDGEIRWDAPTMTTYNLIRALARPYVGAHTWAGATRMIVWRAQLDEEAMTDAWREQPAGAVLAIDDDGMTVRTGDGTLRITDYEPRGDDRVEPGTILTNHA